MRNIWFTIYSSGTNDNKYRGLNGYRTLLEILMIPVIQDKINRDKKAQKIMLCLIPDLEEDLVDNFRNNYFNKKIVRGGIINFEASTKNIVWNSLSNQEKKDYLIEKWKVLFNNLSDDYFVVDKSDVFNSLEELRHEEWEVSTALFKKKLKYNKESYSVVMDVSAEKAEVKLVRESDKKAFKLRDYEPWQILTDADFKNFKLTDDTLTLENNTFFLPPEIFDMREVIK